MVAIYGAAKTAILTVPPCSAAGWLMMTLKSPQPPHTTRVISALGISLSLGRYSASRACAALSAVLFAGVPSASIAYLALHSRATIVKATPVSPISGISRRFCAIVTEAG